jgi:phenylpyruvate tautomerase PptA (4-oxalocrotonate tautomerase family)
MDRVSHEPKGPDQMMFFEVYVPSGALSGDQRRSLAERLITDFMTEDEERGVPSALIEAARMTEQVVVHQVDTWVVGGRAIGADERRYVVRVSVPSGWLREMRQEVISRVTRVLASFDAIPDRVYDEPVAWVYVEGIPDGSCGVFGKAMRSAAGVRRSGDGGRLEV